MGKEEGDDAGLPILNENAEQADQRQRDDQSAEALVQHRVVLAEHRPAGFECVLAQVGVSVGVVVGLRPDVPHERVDIERARTG